MADDIRARLTAGETIGPRYPLGPGLTDVLL